MKLLNEILGTKYPIIQGGMANIATGEFAAACSNAGALGIIGAGGMNADTLRENIRRCKQLTDKPFGVNIMLMPATAGQTQDPRTWPDMPRGWICRCTASAPG